MMSNFNSDGVALQNRQQAYSCLLNNVDISFGVVTITTMDSKQLIKQLEANGWTLRGVKGSHHIFTHPDKSGHISVPHPRQDFGVGLLHKLLKQAGLKKEGRS